MFSYIAYHRLTRMSLFRRTVARFEGARVVDGTAEYEVLPEDESTLPVGSRTEEDEDEDAEGGLMAMSTSIGSLREREQELGLSTGGLDQSISSLREGEVERGPETMGEVEPVVHASFWAIWKVNSMYNIAVMIIYIVTLVRDLYFKPHSYTNRLAGCLPRNYRLCAVRQPKRQPSNIHRDTLHRV